MTIKRQSRFSRRLAGLCNDDATFGCCCCCLTVHSGKCSLAIVQEASVRILVLDKDGQVLQADLVEFHDWTNVRQNQLQVEDTDTHTHEQRRNETRNQTKRKGWVPSAAGCIFFFFFFFFFGDGRWPGGPRRS